MRTTSEMLSLLTAFQSRRHWVESRLPIRGSLIALDILILVAMHTLSGVQLNNKQLRASLPYSEMGIRKQLQRLIAERWLRVEPCAIDKRIRNLVAEAPLIAIMREFAEVLKSDAPPYKTEYGKQLLTFASSHKSALERLDL